MCDIMYIPNNRIGGMALGMLLANAAAVVGRSDAHGEPRARASIADGLRACRSNALSTALLLTVRPVIVNDEDVVGADADGEKQSREVKRYRTNAVHTEIRRGVKMAAPAMLSAPPMPMMIERVSMVMSAIVTHIAATAKLQPCASSSMMLEYARAAPRHAHALSFDDTSSLKPSTT